MTDRSQRVRALAEQHNMTPRQVRRRRLDRFPEADGDALKLIARPVRVTFRRNTSQIGRRTKKYASMPYEYTMLRAHLLTSITGDKCSAGFVNGLWAVVRECAGGKQVIA